MKSSSVELHYYSILYSILARPLITQSIAHQIFARTLLLILLFHCYRKYAAVCEPPSHIDSHRHTIHRGELEKRKHTSARLNWIRFIEGFLEASLKSFCSEKHPWVRVSCKKRSEFVDESRLARLADFYLRFHHRWHCHFFHRWGISSAARARLTAR